jgi:phosphoribosylaminoimidazole-succinocarboxamide synthase
MTAGTASAGVKETNLPGLVRFARGKVRDIYAVGDDQLLIVSTDRVSTFDVVLPTPIPDRGKVLTQLSAFWFGQTGTIVPNHLLSGDLSAFPEAVRGSADQVEGRSMLVRRTKRIDIECVARGYISGSAWSEYRKRGTACGIPLPDGLVESQQLPEPIFTPATKADEGHDENISYERLVEIVGDELAAQLREKTLAIYSYAARVARERGIIIADTKMEFGLLPAGRGIDGPVVRNKQDGAEGILILIDELLTPDSSRFWDAQAYRPGATPASFDKQYLRDWLEQSGWNKEPPAPELPQDVVQATRQRYVEALERLTGKDL